MGAPFLLPLGVCDTVIILSVLTTSFTFVCPTEIIAYSDANAKFAELDTVLIGASVDSVYTHMAWVSMTRLFE